MPRKGVNYTKPPRKLPRQTLGNVAPRSRVLQEQGSSPRHARLSPDRLRRVAALLRSGQPAECLEEAAQLEAAADKLMQRPVRSHVPRTAYEVRGHGWRKLMERAEAAAQLGIKPSSLSVALTRGKGKAQFTRPDGQGNPELITVSVGKLSKTKSAQPA